MTSKEFFDTVKEMRALQKEYSKTRSISSLQKSKEVEKKVDAEIERVDKIINDKQMKLF